MSYFYVILKYNLCTETQYILYCAYIYNAKLLRISEKTAFFRRKIIDLKSCACLQKQNLIIILFNQKLY